MAPLLFPPAGCVRTHFFQAIAQTHHTSTELDHCQKHKHQTSLHDIFMKASNQMHEITLPFIFMIIIIHQENKAAAVNFHQLSPLKKNYLQSFHPQKSSHFRFFLCIFSHLLMHIFNQRIELFDVHSHLGRLPFRSQNHQGVTDPWDIVSTARKLVELVILKCPFLTSNVLGSTSPIMSKMNIYIYI